MVGGASGDAGVFHAIGRAEWAALAAGMRAPLTPAEIAALQGTGDQLDLAEVEDVYLPLSRLLSLYASGAQRLYGETRGFLDGAVAVPDETPFVIGVAGSVAVGKSTISRVLRELLSRWPGTPRVELVTTDGFLYPNAELVRRDLLQRKGFPESYDRRALVDFVSAIKAGEPEVRAPLYSHLVYDIVPGAEVVIRRPDVLIVEGLNVLQPAPQGQALALADLFDFSIYVDAATSDIEDWYVERFLRLRQGSFADPSSYFHRYAGLSDAEAVATARDIWDRINGRNLVENVLPTRERARLVLRKGPNHVVDRVLLRKI
ncbi:MAG: type I pantothenate kinase [Microbacteriaceae bacterium]|nr:type I pantothenate kinase [Microbacteriaceae bacterium]